ncbi:autotransporter outer membrane beta-barrel domain-containing protein [Endozoicomonas atrinae]|uniref:autotransporter family protein n=1 Tax=Endozoicomonas atrinae TaxID=1333660 RepID=UPI0008245817|nr:autotransporter outer membrane beta-barrel domain-containing protein [Endozoicomonas atrinae]
MRTMNAGRKTLLALAISSVMASGSVSASQPIEDLDPIPNPTGDVVIGEFQQINNLNGAAITSEAGSSGYNITNHGLLKGSQHAIHAKVGAKLKALHNYGTIEATNGAAILVEDGGSISYMNNYGTIIGGLVDDNGVIRRVAVDIRGATSDHVDALKIGNKVDGVNVGGEVIGDIYMNNEAGQTNIDGNNKNSYVAFYGSAVDKAIFDGKLIANTAEVNIQSDGYMLLRAQDESIVFDVVDYGADLENQNNGKFDLKSRSTLEMEIDGSLAEDEAVLVVNGDINFGGSNQLIVTGDLEQIAGEHTLISADKVNGFEDEMVQDTWLYDVNVIESEGETIKVEVTYKDTLHPEQLSEAAAANGADVTEQAIIGAFASIVADNTETTPDQITFSSDPHAELAQLLAVSDQQAALLAGELTPDRSGATLHAAQRAQSKQFDAINNRLNSLRADQFHAVNAASSGLWMRVHGNDAKKNVDGRIDGYDVQGMGFSFGIDGDLTENLVTGFSFSQNYQDIDTITYDTNHEVNTYQFSAYGLWNQDNYFATGSVNAGVDYYDSYRTIGESTGFDGETRANAEYKAFHYGLRVTAGLDLAYDNLLLQPIIAGELNNVSIEAYDESGSVASLAYDRQSVTQVKLGAGFNMSTTYEVGPGILAPHFTAMGWYDFNADNHDISGSIILDPSVAGEITTATGSTEIQLNLAAGFDYTIDGGLSLGLGLQHDFVDDGHDTQLQARMNYAF